MEDEEQPKYTPDSDFEELKKEWYSNEGVKFEIVKNLKYRETAIINVADGKKTTRCLKVNAVKYLDMNNGRYNIFGELYNIYGSLACFPQLPMFSFSKHVKYRQQQEFNKDYKKLMTGFDFMMDIDNSDIDEAHKSTKKCKKIFDKFGVPYWLQFSGSKGFHIRVDYDDFPSWLKSKPFDIIANTLKQFAENFRIINNIPDIDLGVFDLRRIAKTPYTVVYPFYLVAYPLTDEEFDNFSIERVSLPYLMQNIEKIKFRGVLKREEKQDGFSKLLKEYLEI